MGEMSLGEGDRVLVLREEMSREPGWVFATCGDDCGYVPRNYLVPEEAPLPYESESTAMPRTVNGTGHTGPSEFCATSI